MDSVLHWLSENFLGMSFLAVATISFFLMFLNSSIQTPPSELICTAAGIFAAATGNNVITLILVSTLGNFLGTSIWFYWGRKHRERSLLGEKTFPDRVVEFLGRRSSEYYIEKFEEHDWVPVFSLRLFPVVRSIVSYPAGRSNLLFHKFAMASIFGIGIWCTIWISVGAFLGGLINSTAVFAFSMTFAILFWFAFAVMHRRKKLQ